MTKYKFTNPKKGEKKLNLELKESEEAVSVVETIVLKKNEMLNVDATVVHKAKNSLAKVLVKAVLYDNAELTFRGNVKVEKNVTNCDSNLSLKVLLVGRGCKVIASPALEIENNDVKCSHSVSISKPSEKETFYLMSRGLSKVFATNLIAQGFVRVEP
ncbi:MAG: SufD family Fe-S cluster assembly protein [Patescibacteria group bacterium]